MIKYNISKLLFEIINFKWALKILKMNCGKETTQPEAECFQVLDSLKSLKMFQFRGTLNVLPSTPFSSFSN